jgi:long-subunit fatty acid transport protein
MIKQILGLVLLGFITLPSNAQYKKASFLSKGGAIYELGGGLTFMSNTLGSKPLQFTYSSALETNDKNGGYYFELGLVTNSKLQFNANYETVSSPTVKNGMLNIERGGMLLTKIGYQYRFFKKGESSKFIPYVRLGMVTCFAPYKETNVLKENNTNEEVINYDKEVSDKMFYYGVNAGAGGTYYINERFGIRVGLEYNQLFGKDKDASYNIPIVQRYQSFPTAILALRYRIPFD